MGLGSLVDFAPVMENDCQFNVFKDEDYDGDAERMRLTASESTASDMLETCFSEENRESFSKITSVGVDDYCNVSLVKDIHPETRKRENGELNGKCVLDEGVVPLHNSGFKRIQPSVNESSTIVPVKQSLSHEKIFFTSDSESVGLAKNEFEVLDRSQTCFDNGVTNDSCVGEVVKGVSKTFPPLSISVSAPLEFEQQPSFSGQDGSQKGPSTKSAPLPQSTFTHSDQKSPAFSTSDDGLVIPSEKTLNKALDLFKIPVTDIITQHSTHPSPASMRTTCTSPSGKKEVAKRKTMQERLSRLPRLVTTCPQLEHAPAMHWAMLLRRFKKYYPVAEYISEEVIQHVLNEDLSFGKIGSEPEFAKSPIDSIARSNLRASRLVEDPDYTESSSDDGDDDDLPGPSTSFDNRPHLSKESAAFRFIKENIELCARDLRAAQIIEDCDRDIEATKQQLLELRKRKATIALNLCEADEEKGEDSARCRQYSSRIRRKLLKFEHSDFGVSKVAEDAARSLDSRERVRAYASLDDRLHPDLSLLSFVPLERRMQAYLKRRATRPLKFLRQRWDRFVWKSQAVSSVGKDRVEQNVVKKDSFDSRNEIAGGGSYSTLRKARRSNHASKTVSPLKRAGKRLVKRSLDQKRNGERYSGGRSRTRHLEKRRAVRFMPRVFREFNHDDSSLQESGLPGLPPKIDYKEICIPPWKFAPLDLSKLELDVPCGHLAESAATAEVSRRHLPLELSERKRFQQYRDFVASKTAGSLTTETAVSKLSGSGPPSKVAGNGPTVAASSLETPSSACSRAQSPTALSSLEDERHVAILDACAIPEYDRPSIATPYTPRHFPLSSPICQKSP